MPFRGRHQLERRLAWAGVGANLLGATDVFFFGALLAPITPSDGVDRAEVVLANAALFVPFMTSTLIIGDRWAYGRFRKLEPWMDSDRDPTPEERGQALRLPLLQARITAFFWALAAVVFTIYNAFVAPEVAVAVPALLILGGITTATVNYLLAERILRPMTARALAAGLPDRPVGPGVSARARIVWASATAVPLLGIAVTAGAALLSNDVDVELLAAGMLFLAVLTGFVSYAATTLSARAITEPLGEMRSALERVEEGDLDVRIPVDDGSEVGLVEAGFNRMAAGLRERERLHDLFGRHVGRDVAKAALAHDGEVELGGEVREVAVVFVDVIGSTRLAGRRPPGEVVALLNTFFGLVVEVVEEHGGWVNKFEGDAALCIFGAPTARADAAGDALRAACCLRERIAEGLSGADAGIGVSAGPAVAGNVGAQERFEYTVIGDAVNEAARLSELAKQRAGHLLASQAVLSRAAAVEAGRWEVGEEVLLRGRDEPTAVATPRRLRAAPADAPPPLGAHGVA